MPSAMLRNAGLGTSSTVDSETSTVRPLNATALPAVPIVSAIASIDAWRRSGSSRAAVQRGAEADDDEQRVVDAQREGEHHREVQRPDADRRDVGGEHQRAGGGEQPDQRQHQRQAGGDEAAERDARARSS